MASLEDWLRERGGGVAHTADLYAAGFGKHAIAARVRAGTLIRIRRSWLILPGTNHARVAAVRAGGRLTCVSAAAELHLWTPEHDEVHVAVPPTAARIDRTGLRVHWSSGPAPVARRAVIDPLINILFHIARCNPPAAALAVWESALRKGLIAADVLQRIAWRSARAARLAAISSQLSDSGLETHFVELMRAIGVPVRQQVWIDGHPVDALIGERLVVQIDGFAHHSSPEARRRDILADARLRLRGYTVIRFDYHQILFQPETVQEIIRASIAQGLHLAA